MIPASLDDANRDPRMRGAPLTIYVWALRSLDVFEFRPVKILAVATHLRAKPHTVIFGLRRLVALGYIERGPRPRGEARQYRLRASPAQARAA